MARNHIFLICGLASVTIVCRWPKNLGVSISLCWAISDSVRLYHVAGFDPGRRLRPFDHYSCEISPVNPWEGRETKVVIAGTFIRQSKEVPLGCLRSFPVNWIQANRNHLGILCQQGISIVEILSRFFPTCTRISWSDLSSGISRAFSRR